ncbi:MAG: hypothetical protein LBU04_00825, partial [Christensenellaceae bacterium]|nr:hypothetical protein [Christensenellaceae bacterium]
MTKESNEQALKEAVKKYFMEVSDCYNLGNIESPYYKATINLLESFGCRAIDVSSGRSGSLGQNTDLKIWHLEDDINMSASFAAVEVKSIGGKESTPDQIKIEKEKHKNLIFTDNLIWQFYTADRKEMYIEITLISQYKNGFKLNEDKIDLFIQTLSTFILLPANINSSAKLAEYMASYGKHLREIVKSILTNEYASAYETLNAIYLKLKTDLVSSLTVNDFADMFAQTIVYGFFIARYNCNKEEKFDRLKAVE